MKADDLAQTLEARMRTEMESTVMESRKFFSLVTARLKDDDRTLQKLEGLASRIGSDDQDRAAGKRAAELTTRLSGYVSE
jgi:predicted ATP-dependent protease